MHESRGLGDVYKRQPLLRPGGRLLYATCSVLAEENSQLVNRFVAQRPDAESLPLEATWGVAVAGGRQLLPTPGGTDGLFYALLHKRQ